MPKGKKDKKEKKKVRKFNLDLFGILTLTRIHGDPFENFMFSSDAGGKGGKAAPKGGKKDKKGKAEEKAPKLEMFPPPTENYAKETRHMRNLEKQKDDPDFFIPLTSVGHKEKTTRPHRPLEEGGSLSDVMCGKRYPLPPRPQPHGGIYGDEKCAACAGEGGLLPTGYQKLNKKLRTMLYKEFDKAKIVIQWLSERINKSMQSYEGHMKHILIQLGPAMDAVDQSEWDDHFEVRGLIEQWREDQTEVERLRHELKQFRKNKEEEISKAVAEKTKEVEEIERQMIAIEKKVQEAAETLLQWQTDPQGVLLKTEAQVTNTIALLQKIRESIFNERETLRHLLSWEMSVATNQTVTVMENIIRQDLDVVVSWMHPAWFRLFSENRKMQEERSRLRIENHLLELEVNTFQRQVNQMEGQQREIESNKTQFITPPSLQEKVDKYFRAYDMMVSEDACGSSGPALLLQDYPTSKLIHE